MLETDTAHYKFSHQSTIDEDIAEDRDAHKRDLDDISAKQDSEQNQEEYCNDNDDI